MFQCTLILLTNLMRPGQPYPARVRISGGPPVAEVEVQLIQVQPQPERTLARAKIRVASNRRGYAKLSFDLDGSSTPGSIVVLRAEVSTSSTQYPAASSKPVHVQVI